MLNRSVKSLGLGAFACEEKGLGNGEYICLAEANLDIFWANKTILLVSYILKESLLYQQLASRLINAKRVGEISAILKGNATNPPHTCRSPSMFLIPA